MGTIMQWGGFVLIAVGGLHLALNWGWYKSVFFKKKAGAASR